MAKRRTRRRAASAQIVRTVRAPAPVVRVSVPRSAVRHRRGRSKGGGGGGGSLTTSRMFALGLGGAALGFIEKSFPSLPTLPIIGRKGTIALACYYFSKGKGGHNSLLRDVAIAASSIAGYELGTTGKISGDSYDGVAGVAAQT
jgi:hypothetical protein